jgi:signal transduction histidine kinase
VQDVDALERLERVLRGLPIAFMSLTCEFPPRCSWASGSIEIVSGFPARSFMEDPLFWLSRVHPDERVYSATDIDVRISRVGVSQTEFRWQHGDGAYYWYRCQRTTTQMESGREIVVAWLPIERVKGAADEAQRADVQRELGLRLEAAREKDHQRIARDLHDQLGSRLTAVLLELEALEHRLEAGDVRDTATRIREEIRAAGSDLGRVTRGIYPVSLDVGTFSSALNELAREHERIHHISTRVLVIGIEESRVSKRTAICLYRIVQEALTNVAKHSRAHSVSVVVRGDAERCVRAVVEDDGCGFNADMARGTDHIGLHSMRKRAALLGGTLTVETARGRGTAVHVVVPIDAPASSTSGGWT